MHDPTTDDPNVVQHVDICRFKSLREVQRLELRPLTVLAGGNSSGKSSLMQPLLLLKQSAEAQFDPGLLRLDGPHVTFTDPTQVVTREPGSSQDAYFDVSWGPCFGADVRDRYHARQVQGTVFEFHSRERSLRYPNRDWQVLKGEPDHATVRGMGGTQDQVNGLVGLGRNLLDYRLQWHLASLLHLPGLRGHRERLYPWTRVPSEHDVQPAEVLGPFTTYVASILASWLSEGDARIDAVSNGMARLGLTGRVSAQRVSGVHVNLQVGRTLLGRDADLVDIADVGVGVSQVLPVLVAMEAARPGQWLYVEQPELHLHPSAQVSLGRLLAEHAARGVRVIAETHSPLLLRSIQEAVARRVVPASDVALHWVARDPRTGYSTVTLADLDDRGTFGDWPVDFAAVEAQIDRAWLEAAFEATG